MLIKSFQEAEQIEKIIAKELGYPLISINGATGLPDPSMQATLKWSDIEEKEGKYYIVDPWDKDIDVASIDAIYCNNLKDE